MTLSLFATEDGEHSTVTGGLVELSASRKGDIAESSFITACQLRDYDIFKPFGHAQSADVCLVKAGGSPMLAQIKTASKDPDKHNNYHISISKGVSKSAYKPGDFHILAAYLPDRNEFVLWALEELRGRVTLRYSPERHRQPSNWHLLDEVQKTVNSSWGCTADVLPSSVHLSSTQRNINKLNQ